MVRAEDIPDAGRVACGSAAQCSSIATKSDGTGLITVRLGRRKKEKKRRWERELCVGT